MTMSSSKVKLILKFILTLLFMGYYISITMFYHSHVINGEEIVHSHFYIATNNTSDDPVKHTHSQYELFTLQIISQFVTTVVTVGIFLRMTRFLMNEFLIPLSESIPEITPLFSYSLRGPPSGSSFL